MSRLVTSLPKFYLSGVKTLTTPAMNLHTKSSPRNDRFKGKVAIVTASTEGIGFSIAKRLAEEGASVIISSRRKAKVDQAYQELKSQGLDVCATVCHVGEEEDRKRLVEFALKEKGAIDFLVSNAAVNPYAGPILEASDLVWDKIFDINVKAAFLLTKEVIPHMEKRGGGSIVFISSVAGFQAMPLLGLYSVSKTALLGLSRALAVECSPLNIRINSVCPGVIRTKFSAFLQDDNDTSKMFKELIPLRRLGEPDEVAPMVSFLLSDDASYVTGENFVVSGGLFCRL